MIIVCVCVCVCVVFKKEVTWKSNNTGTEERVSTLLCMNAPEFRGWDIFLIAPSQLHFSALTQVPLGWAGIFVTSTVAGPAPVSSLTCLLTSPAASLAGLKSFFEKKNKKKKTLQWLSLTLLPEQERRLSVDLSGGHRSGKLQRGKIRELSLSGVCVRWISRGSGEIAACVICGWVCQTFGLVLFFNFHSTTECRPKPPAPLLRRESFLLFSWHSYSYT